MRRALQLCKLSARGQYPVNMAQVLGFCKFPRNPPFGGVPSLKHPPRKLIMNIQLNRYYVLIAACIFARKAEWLRNACLAAALLFPAVAALHGIILAAVHVDGEYSVLGWVPIANLWNQVLLIWMFMELFNYVR